MIAWVHHQVQHEAFVADLSTHVIWSAPGKAFWVFCPLHDLQQTQDKVLVSPTLACFQIWPALNPEMQGLFGSVCVLSYALHPEP